MDKIYYENILYRILQGRLRLPFCDPVLYLHEPSIDILEESYDIYKKAYDDAYFRGVYLKEELKEVLFYNDMWSPEDDQKAKEAEEEVERLKVSCYENYYDVPKLKSLKLSIRLAERLFTKHKSRIHSLDHTSCEGAGSLARSIWIISKTIKDKDGKDVDSQDLPLTKILEYYNGKAIDSLDIRYIARNEPFRSMWSVGKKNSNVFDRPSIELTKDQRTLCQFSIMYDSVYESSEAPDDEVVNDDDCLDGWFIVQRREYEKGKNKRQMEKLLKNSKISNSDEIFLMAKDKHTATKINDMNDVVAKGIINSRNQQIKDKGTLKFTELSDVKQDIATQSHHKALSHMRGK